MTIDEAIKILSGENFGNRWPAPKAEGEAIKLGIEALKRVKSLRLHGKPDRYSILPGETEE